jgi:hypothetical protein
MMRRGAAWAVLAVAWSAVAGLLGAEIRGDLQGAEPLRDLATGASLLGVVAAVKWASVELEGRPGA